MTNLQRAKQKRLSDEAVKAGKKFMDSSYKKDSKEYIMLSNKWIKACKLADSYNPQ